MHAVLRWRVSTIAICLVVVAFGCYSHQVEPTLVTLVDKQRNPPGVLDSEDYEIFKCLVVDTCHEFGTTSVVVHSMTLSHDNTRTLRHAIDREFLMDRCQIDSLLFCNLVATTDICCEQLAIDGYSVRTSDVFSGPQDGLAIAVTTPVLSSDGDAYVFVRAFNGESGGDTVYHVIRDDAGWRISQRALLSMQ